jgi:hypothetical protein
MDIIPDIKPLVILCETAFPIGYVYYHNGVKKLNFMLYTQYKELCNMFCCCAHQTPSPTNQPCNTISMQSQHNTADTQLYSNVNATVRQRNVELVLKNYWEGIQPQPLHISHSVKLPKFCTQKPRYLSDKIYTASNHEHSGTILTFMKNMTAA